MVLGLASFCLRRQWVCVAPWSSFRGRAATATAAVEPNPRAAGLLAGRAHKGCVIHGIRCCPQASALPLHLVLLYQFLFYFDRCRFCGQPPHISVSSQGFNVGRCNIASPEVSWYRLYLKIQIQLQSSLSITARQDDGEKYPLGGVGRFGQQHVKYFKN